jgi:diaminopimelate epimerase
MCDVHFGIGSNGLLLGPSRAPDGSLEFRIINSDGSFAGFSGNGARIFAQYLIDADYVKAASSFSFFACSHNGGRIRVDARLAADDPSALVTDLNVMPSFGAAAVGASSNAVAGIGDRLTVPAIEALATRMGLPAGSWADSSPLSIGNPHCVTFVASATLLPAFDLLQRFSSDLAAIADNPAGRPFSTFREGCNLQWAFVDARDRILLRIVERGEGPTLASGSSASAATIAAWRRGLVDKKVEVVMPGGTLSAEINGSSDRIASVTLTARAVRIAEIHTDF